MRGRKGDPLAEVGTALLRLAVGVLFFAHGAQKLLPVWGSTGLAGTAEQLTSLGFAGATMLAVLVGAIELGGGVLLVAGAYTRWASLLLLADVTLFAWKAHLAHGFFLNWTLAPGTGHGVEYHLVLFAALVCLVFTGAGAVSVDGYRHRAAEAAAAGRARLRSGM